MRIAIDIDSTLHHYWDVLSDISRSRFGVELPYEEQLTWGTTRLRSEQLAVCVRESYSEARILAAVPYPGAVDTVTGWHAQGHAVYVMSQRDPGCRGATARWLQAIGLPCEQLECTHRKISRCVELGVGLLVDDSPLNLLDALEHGLLAATIEHPWNEEVREEEDVIHAPDWPTLGELLEPVLAGRHPALGPSRA